MQARYTILVTLTAALAAVLAVRTPTTASRAVPWIGRPPPVWAL
jgi:hypothetical protein